MTSPTQLVLLLAHVWSVFGSASANAADHDSKLTNTQTDPKPYPGTHNALWTKMNNEGINNRINETEDVFIGHPKTNIGLMMHYMYDRRMRDFNGMVVKRRSKREDDTRCEAFQYTPDAQTITHPHATNNKTYYSNINCTTLIFAPKNKVIELTFINEFHIEDHPECIYDYLEIRDGREGYAKSMGRVCGTAFPNKLTTSGPYAWLKFHADETIEYEGFTIKINFKDGPSISVPDSCYHKMEGKFGDIRLKNINPNCEKESLDLDILWTIKTPPNTKIYLNFTVFELANPNDCEKNLVEVFGVSAQADNRLALFCGSIANPVNTKDGKDIHGDETGNIMNVRLYIDQGLKKKTKFNATFTAYRTLDPSKDEKCTSDEFDCEDYTCIDGSLKCKEVAHCRLKTDVNNCKAEAVSTISDQTHILVILIIFSLILSTMSFVFLFKCIRKLYQDHNIIKEHIRQSCEDRLDSLVGSRLTLDAKRLQRDSEPRASLERENQANEMFKRKRESFSKKKSTSVDSDYIQETNLDIEDENWRREVDSVHVEPEDIRIERNGRTRRSEKERRSERRSDTSKKEESLRSKRESAEREREKEREREEEREREREREKERREIRDASVGAPDTKESGCQTRESLFQTDAPPSSDGSGTNSRGFSTFGYSGASLARPSPAATNTSEITIQLLRQAPRQDSVKPQKKQPDRRPISAETTRSAPDVIIVSKPIR